MTALRVRPASSHPDAHAARVNHARRVLDRDRVSVAIWPSGHVAMWPSGRLAIWPCGRLAVWPCGRLAVWPCGRLAVLAPLVVITRRKFKGQKIFGNARHDRHDFHTPHRCVVVAAAEERDGRPVCRAFVSPRQLLGGRSVRCVSSWPKPSRAYDVAQRERLSEGHVKGNESTSYPPRSNPRKRLSARAARLPSRCGSRSIRAPGIGTMPTISTTPC
jgi:hypothetical protein